jgi:hypothetical protein
LAINNNPIYSRLADVDGSAVITAAANDYTGYGLNNVPIFVADPTNGGFVQRIRFKALGTNVATVARIFINNGNLRYSTTLSGVSGTPTGTPSGTGGTLATGSYFAKIYAVDQYGGTTAASAETAAITVTGPTGSITYNWTAVSGAASYIIVVGLATNQQIVTFTSTTNTYQQTTPGVPAIETDFLNNNYFYGEISLPATTSSVSAATVDIDYPMNFALAPGQSILVGLGSAVAAGWVCTTIAGKY